MQAIVTLINAEKEEAIAKAEDELKEVSDVAEQLNSKNIELQEQLEITSKLKKEKAFGDTKLIEVQTELKILIATSKEKEKSKMALEDQLKTLKFLIENIEKEVKPRATKKAVKN